MVRISVVQRLRLSLHRISNRVTAASSIRATALVASNIMLSISRLRRSWERASGASIGGVLLSQLVTVRRIII